MTLQYFEYPRQGKNLVSILPWRSSQEKWQIASTIYREETIEFGLDGLVQFGWGHSWAPYDDSRHLGNIEL